MKNHFVLTLVILGFLISTSVMILFNPQGVIANQYDLELSQTEVVTTEMAKFEDWAKKHGITLKTLNEKNLKSSQVQGMFLAANTLYQIPDELLENMNGKTIYFSNQYGRSFSVISPELQSNVEGFEPGIVLKQEITSYETLHELAHIIDYQGIQGIGDSQKVFNDLQSQREKIFEINSIPDLNSDEIPPGHISIYSVVDDEENFAEHFTFYVLYPDEFRKRMQNDPELYEKYFFFRDFIFNGKEY